MSAEHRTRMKKAESTTNEVKPASSGSGTIESKPSTSNAHVVEWPRVVRRLLILAAAICYISVSMIAAFRSMSVLRGVVNHTLVPVPYVSWLIPHYAGSSTIRLSPLVTTVLGNSTAPRSEALYLISQTRVSSENCGSDASTFNPWTYNNSYMRRNLAVLTTDTSYNLSFLADSELIVPVVDCTSGAIEFADDSAIRVFYLMRKTQDHDDVYLLTWSLSTQDYRLPGENQDGATASITLTYLNDVRESTVEYYHVMRLGFPFQMNSYQAYTLRGRNEESFWELESIPRDSVGEVSKTVYTACRTGFYVKAETEQSNIKNLNWDLLQDPREAMKVWAWSGYTVVRDSWAWVHGAHFFFAADTLFNLFVLVVVVYHNTREGKLWVGDAFVSVSAALAFRSVVVLATWYVNGFWTLMEFCLKESNELADVQRIFAFPDIIHADLLTLFLGLSGLMGFILRERIDPALAVFLFEVGFHYRRTIAKWFPKTMQVASAYARYDYLKALAPMQQKHASLTPMRLWTMHKLVDKDAEFICATLFPIFATLIVVIVYAPARKVYRHFVPDRKIILSRMTGASTNEAESLLAWKSHLTIFEVATGAPLQDRVGLVSGYDNCVYIKGLKFASADGVYSNGYVIVNHKWLVSTNDLLAMIVMIVTRVRFKNVYIYEINGHTVQQMARLVYPETMGLQELLRLSISILA